MSVERALHDAALDTLAAAVNQPHPPKPGRVGRADVLVDDGGDVGWCEGVEIELRLDGDEKRHNPTNADCRLLPIVIRRSAIVNQSALIRSAIFNVFALVCTPPQPSW